MWIRLLESQAAKTYIRFLFFPPYTKNLPKIIFFYLVAIQDTSVSPISSICITNTFSLNVFERKNVDLLMKKMFQVIKNSFSERRFKIN